MECDIAVVGGGVLGVTTAFWLNELYDCSVKVLDKKGGVAQQTTLRNTGIAHRPFYLSPDKKRVFARSAERSHDLWKALATRNGVPWNEIGTLMVATELQQLKKLEEYEKWGVRNGLDGRECSLLNPQEVAEVEPSVKCEGAILSRRDASTDFAALTRAVWAMASENGATLLPEAELVDVEPEGDGLALSLGDGRSLSCSFMINAAGGSSLDIAHWMGLATEYTDLHFRGEYWEVEAARAPRVGRSVYSVAGHERFPFLDPHYVVRADGRREVGPNAVLVAGPETYEGLGGAWGVASKVAERPLGPKARLFTSGEFLSLVWGEWRSSLSKRAMCERVRKFIPSLEPEMLFARGLSGVRSSLVGKEGFVDEAMVLKGDNSLHVLNYNSPGATGAPVFSASLVRGLAGEGFLDRFRAKQKKAGIWDYEATAIE